MISALSIAVMLEPQTYHTSKKINASLNY